MLKLSMYDANLIINEETLEITGQTFQVKENLKKYWGCKYNPENKSWILPEKNKDEFLEKFAIVEKKEDEEIKIDEVTEMINNEEITTAKITTRKHNGLCPHCGTYCYGDCRINK